MRFGLIRWHDPDQEIISDWLWFEPLNGKRISERYLEESLDKEQRTINELKLMPYEDILVINFRVPYQVYIEQIERLYEAQGLKKPLKPFQVDKFEDSLKVYDLRTWGEKDENRILVKGKKVPGIGWARIGAYLKPKTPLDVSNVKKKYQSAQEMINGKYIEYMRIKSHE